MIGYESGHSSNITNRSSVPLSPPNVHNARKTNGACLLSLYIITPHTFMAPTTIFHATFDAWAPFLCRVYGRYTSLSLGQSHRPRRLAAFGSEMMTSPGTSSGFKNCVWHAARDVRLYLPSKRPSDWCQWRTRHLHAVENNSVRRTKQTLSLSEAREVLNAL